MHDSLSSFSIFHDVGLHVVLIFLHMVNVVAFDLYTLFPTSLGEKKTTFQDKDLFGKASSNHPGPLVPPQKWFLFNPIKTTLVYTFRREVAGEGHLFFQS